MHLAGNGAPASAACLPLPVALPCSGNVALNASAPLSTSPHRLQVFTMLLYKDYRRQKAEQELVRGGGAGLNLGGRDSGGRGGSPRAGGAGGGNHGGLDAGGSGGGDEPHLGRAPGNEKKQLLGQQRGGEATHDGPYKTF